MNKTLRAFALQKLKTLLAQCSPAEQSVFRRMYASKLPENTPVEQVVDAMPDELSTVDWALTQVENTLAGKAIKAAKQTDAEARRAAVIKSILAGVTRAGKS
jgi:hypothetical protein